MNQEVEPRPAAWVEDLTSLSAIQVRDCLKLSNLGTTRTQWGLEVKQFGKARQLAVVGVDANMGMDAEGKAELMERAEVALREAGFALILARRQMEDGWASPFIQIYGKSAVGPGPRTIRKTVKTMETPVVDLDSGFWNR